MDGWGLACLQIVMLMAGPDSHSSVPVDVVQTLADGTTDAVLLDSGVTAISAGDRHTCAVHSGAAKCWGLNTNGQLGNGNSNPRLFPRNVVLTPPDADAGTDAVLLDSGVTAISAGKFHSCAVHSGTAKCWGLNTNGQLGKELGNDESSNPITQSNNPVQVTGLGSGVTAISAGEAHTCAVHSGEAKCWGLNEGQGQLGVGDLASDATSTSTPQKVSF